MVILFLSKLLQKNCCEFFKMNSFDLNTGLPSYTQWREPCGLSPILEWEDLARVVGPKSAHRLQLAYTTVDDIDLFVGGLAERPVVGGIHFHFKNIHFDTVSNAYDLSAHRASRTSFCMHYSSTVQ